MRPFDRNDWYSYAGAENFNDGSSPMICDNAYDDMIILIDRNTIEIHIFDLYKEDEETIYFLNTNLSKNYKVSLVKRLIEELRCLFPVEIENILTKYGFTKSLIL